MEDKHQFAGFWKRFLAIWIDNTIVIMASFIVGLVCFFVFSIATMLNDELTRSILSIVAYILHVGANILYHAFFKSSKYQATPGKMALGIVVTNATGGRIGLGRAIARNAARFLSELVLCIGYMIAGFTDRRQAIHDLVAGTLVVKKDAPIRLGVDGQQIMVGGFGGAI